MNLLVQAALEERDREVQNALAERKKSLGEVEKAKEEMEDAKMKMERMRKEREASVNEQKPQEDNLELFRALAEKLGETLESVCVELDIILILYI